MQGNMPFFAKNGGLLPAEAIDLIIYAPNVPHREPDKVLTTSAFEIDIHVAEQMSFFRWALEVLSEQGSIIYYHNSLPIDVHQPCPNQWAHQLYLQQILTWIPTHEDGDYGEVVVNHEEPDNFFTRAHTVWWFVKSSSFYLDRGNRTNMVVGTWTGFIKEMIASLTPVGAKVVGDKTVEAACLDMERECVRI